MKNFLYFLLIVALVSCKNDERVIIDTKSQVEKSKSYKEAVVQQGGDFLGLILGEEFETASKILPTVLPADITTEEDENFLYYRLEHIYTVTEYQLFFDNNKLEEINFDAIVYNEKGDFDENGAIELFNDLKDDFIKFYGNKYMTSSDEDNEILFWNKGNKNVQLILEKAKVHVYLDIALK